MKMRGYIALFAAMVMGSLGLYTQPAAAASVNNFTITSFDASYHLARDNENRSVLTTTETITARFPQSNQNHGLERAIPTEYDSHPVRLTIESVTNENGVEQEYHTIKQGDLSILRIGSASRYVHGLNTYKITYKQTDVTRYFGDTDRDEWYWDLNGTEWNVPINAFNATITFDPKIEAVLTGDSACYQGAYGASDACTIE